jgi:DNA ligase-associated metallophosphoesterase
MDKSRLEIRPKLWLDHRRAVFLEEESLLAVADLHLGYAWAHRFSGQMLPLHPGDSPIERLLDLCSLYQPRRIALLGDIVHRAVPVDAVVQDFRTLLRELSARASLQLVLGNHDRGLDSLAGQAVPFHPLLRAGNYILLHGNDGPPEPPGSFIIMGHEHPAISLGDGIKGAKFPCFLLSDEVLILPAFSLYAAGSPAAQGSFMSPVARRTRFHQAVAICGSRLLPVKL